MIQKKLDIAANRKAIKYSTHENLRRVLRALAMPLFRCSPRPLFRWRGFLLRMFGAQLGRGVNIYNSAIIIMPWNLVIDDWASIGERALIYNLGLLPLVQTRPFHSRLISVPGRTTTRTPPCKSLPLSLATKPGCVPTLLLGQVLMLVRGPLLELVRLW